MLVKNSRRLLPNCRFYSAAGRWVREIGRGEGNEHGYFRRPHGLALYQPRRVSRLPEGLEGLEGQDGPEDVRQQLPQVGMLFVADWGNNRVQVRPSQDRREEIGLDRIVCLCV